MQNIKKSINKKKTTTIIIPAKFRKYPLEITYTWKIKKGEEMVHVVCKWAKIDKDYRRRQIPVLLKNIEDLILIEQKQTKNSNINIRVKQKDKDLIQEYALRWGYNSISEYMLAKALSK